MTDDSNVAGNGPAKDSNAFNDLSASAVNVSGKLTMGERLIAIGALLILVVDLLIGSWILDDYAVANTTWLISVGLLAAMFFFYSGAERAWHPLYGTMVRVGAWAIGLIAVDALIDRTIIASFRPSGAPMVFEAFLWIAGALCIVGALQLRSNSR